MGRRYHQDVEAKFEELRKRQPTKPLPNRKQVSPMLLGVELDTAVKAYVENIDPKARRRLNRDCNRFTYPKTRNINTNREINTAKCLFSSYGIAILIWLHSICIVYVATCTVFMQCGSAANVLGWWYIYIMPCSLLNL